MSKTAIKNIKVEVVRSFLFEKKFASIGQQISLAESKAKLFKQNGYVRFVEAKAKAKVTDKK